MLRSFPPTLPRDVESASQVTTMATACPSGGLTGTPLVALQWNQTISRTVNDATWTANTKTLYSSQAGFNANDVGSKVSDAQGLLPSNDTIAPQSQWPSGGTGVFLTPTAVTQDNPSTVDPVTFTKTTGPWLAAYWAVPNGGSTDKIVRYLCSLATGTQLLSTTTVARDVPANQASATVVCTSCSPSSTWVPVTNITSVNLADSEPASGYQFNLTATPRYANDPTGGHRWRLRRRCYWLEGGPVR